MDDTANDTSIVAMIYWATSSSQALVRQRLIAPSAQPFLVVSHTYALIKSDAVVSPKLAFLAISFYLFWVILTPTSSYGRVIPTRLALAVQPVGARGALIEEFGSARKEHPAATTRSDLHTGVNVPSG